MITTTMTPDTTKAHSRAHSDWPIAIAFPKRRMLYVRYGDNEIYIYFSECYSNKYSPQVVDITDKPPMLSRSDLLIRNGTRHQHIVGTYHPESDLLIIKHCKRTYIVKLPGDVSVKEIYCGGRAHRIPKANIA